MRFEECRNQTPVILLGLEPTNNAAEQAIRHIVIDRRITQGTRSVRGREWCQRIWTTIATCPQHGRDLLTFLGESFRALLITVFESPKTRNCHGQVAQCELRIRP